MCVQALDRCASIARVWDRGPHPDRQGMCRKTDWIVFCACQESVNNPHQLSAAKSKRIGLFYSCILELKRSPWQQRPADCSCDVELWGHLPLCCTTAPGQWKEAGAFCLSVIEVSDRDISLCAASSQQCDVKNSVTGEPSLGSPAFYLLRAVTAHGSYFLVTSCLFCHI